MKIRFPGILGVFAAILMVASFVIPVNIAVPSAVSADPGIMKWDTVSTPGSYPTANDILNLHGTGANTGQGSEILDMAIGNDGKTVIAIARTFRGNTAATRYYWNRIYRSSNNGISFSGSRDNALRRHILWAPVAGTERNIFQVAVAPDDPGFIVVIHQRSGAKVHRLEFRRSVALWVSTDAGQNWDLAFDGAAAGVLAAGETIRDIDISIDYGGKRDIGFVTTSAAGGRWFVRPSSGFTGWLAPAQCQRLRRWHAAAAIWYDAIKFSPTYNGDSSVALVYSDCTLATYFQVALRDLNQNMTLQYAYGVPGIEVKNPASACLASPGSAHSTMLTCSSRPTSPASLPHCAGLM